MGKTCTRSNTSLSFCRMLLSILIVLTMIFIFSRSFRNPSESIEESQQAMNLLFPVLEFIFGAGNVTVTLVRKLAHFVEFGVLGFETGLLTRKLTPAPFLFCLLTAMTDETIQIFTDRGSQIQDVWLDFIGAIVGILASKAILGISNLTRSKRCRSD